MKFTNENGKKGLFRAYFTIYLCIKNDFSKK